MISNINGVTWLLNYFELVLNHELPEKKVLNVKIFIPRGCSWDISYTYALIIDFLVMFEHHIFDSKSSFDTSTFSNDFEFFLFDTPDDTPGDSWLRVCLVFGPLKCRTPPALVSSPVASYSWAYAYVYEHKWTQMLRKLSTSSTASMLVRQPPAFLSIKNFVR